MIVARKWKSIDGLMVPDYYGGQCRRLLPNKDSAITLYYTGRDLPLCTTLLFEALTVLLLCSKLRKRRGFDALSSMAKSG